jgi:RNA polymerase sigma factor (sigma-70 family)
MEDLALLIGMAQAGNVEAYGQIMIRFEGMALSHARSLLGDFHEAEDAVQDAFVNAYTALPDLRKVSGFPNWLKRIVFKHCDRRTRRHKLPSTTIDATAGVPCDSPGPDEQLRLKELRQRVMQAIKDLPEQQRATTQMFYVDGHSQREVAEFMKVPVSTIKKRLRSARKQMRSAMAYLDEEDE